MRMARLLLMVSALLAAPIHADNVPSDAQIQIALQAAEAGQPYDAASIAASPIAA